MLTDRDSRGRLGVRPVGFGCGPNAGLMVSEDTEHRRRVVGTACACGIDFFDTAPAYGDGTSEANLARALGERAGDVAVFTKVLVGSEELDDPGGAVVRSVEDSLRRTGLERFAGVTLHNRLATGRGPRRTLGIGPMLDVDEVLGPGGVVEALEGLRDAGTVGSMGFTTLGGDAAAIDAVIASGRCDYVNAIYGLLGPLDRGMPPISGPRGYDPVAAAVAGGLDVIALRVLGGGLLLEPADEHRAAVEALRGWAAERGTTLPRLALRYALSNPDISAAVIGFTEPQHVTDAVAAVRAGPLAADDIDELHRLRGSEPAREVHT